MVFCVFLEVERHSLMLVIKNNLTASKIYLRVTKLGLVIIANLHQWAVCMQKQSFPEIINPSYINKI